MDRVLEVDDLEKPHPLRVQDLVGDHQADSAVVHDGAIRPTTALQEVVRIVLDPFQGERQRYLGVGVKCL